MQKSAYKHRLNYSNDSGNGSSNHNNSSSSSRGRASPQSPSQTEEDRLSPEPAKVKRKVSKALWLWCVQTWTNFLLLQSSPKIVGTCNCDDLLPIQCHLETKELWDKFHELGTEMIITKTGRWVHAIIWKYPCRLGGHVTIYYFYGLEMSPPLVEGNPECSYNHPFWIWHHIRDTFLAELQTVTANFVCHKTDHKIDISSHK